MQIVYIMGRGHSGTTALNTLLGNASGIFGGGEIISGIGNVDPGSDLCSCGNDIEHCEVWGEVSTHMQDKLGLSLRVIGKQLAGFTHLRHMPRILSMLGGKNDPTLSEIVALNQSLFESIGVVTQDKLLIDSTKELSRAALLQRFFSTTRIIYMTRNPRDVVLSYSRRISNGMPFKFLRKLYYPNTRFRRILMEVLVCISWTLGSLIAELIRLKKPKKVLHVRYEDLLSDPNNELERIGQFLGVDLSTVAEKVYSNQKLSLGHQIGGNEFRHEKYFLFRYGNFTRNRNFMHTIITWVLCWPFLLLYRYK